MDYKVTTQAIDKAKSPCLVVPIFSGKTLSAAAEKLDKATQGLVKSLIKRGDIQSEIGKSLLLPLTGVAAERVLFLGCGKAEALTDRQFRKIAAEAVKTLFTIDCKSADWYLHELEVADRNFNWQIRQVILMLEAKCYQFTDYKSSKAKVRKLKSLQFAVPSKKSAGTAELAIAEGVAMAHGVATAKDLGNTPANICTPSFLANTAKKFDKNHKKIKTTILEEAQMKKLGMHSLLSVSQGSSEPAKLIVMEYRGTAKTKKPYVFVGKGITFDSGGISLKPGAGMDEMKFDMCGAAAVFGVVQAVAELGLPINVTAVVAASENMPSGSATKPGDVVTSMSGQTIEILNTDAEGRLVLCDALTYVEKFKPECVIDVATLTGAMVVALGDQASGVMTNHEPLYRQLQAAGETQGDRVWEFPIWEEYQEQLDSNFADMANIGSRGAGSITAACFLARFTKNYQWAHMDIAGTAWLSGKAKGATGRPVPALMQFLLDRCNK